VPFVSFSLITVHDIVHLFFKKRKIEKEEEENKEKKEE